MRPEVIHPSSGSRLFGIPLFAAARIRGIHWEQGFNLAAVCHVQGGSRLEYPYQIFKPHGLSSVRDYLGILELSESKKIAETLIS